MDGLAEERDAWPDELVAIAADQDAVLGVGRRVGPVRVEVR